MNFSKEKNREFYLLTTEVENFLINEYMPAAPGDYVKVYLYGLMYAQQRQEMTHEALAQQLRLSIEEVDRAWSYWAEMHVVRRIPRGERTEAVGGKNLPYDIVFVNLREQMYGKPTEPGGFAGEGAEEDQAFNAELKAMLEQIEQLAGKILSARETEEIYSWLKDFGATPEVICYAWEYCCDKGKRNIKYISKVVAQWSRQGFRTVADVQEFLDGIEQKYAVQKRILQALGMNRSATEAEKALIDTWFNEMHFNLDRVLEACGKTVSIANPNLRYVNKVLENWYQEAKAEGRDVNKKVIVTQTVLNQYYEYLRRREEQAAQERKAEVYSKLPRIEEIDRRLNILHSGISKNLLRGGDQTALQKSREEMHRLEEERAVLLTENNFSIDYTDVQYSCELCKDTGVTDEGQRCSCTKRRIEEAELWQKKSE